MNRDVKLPSSAIAPVYRADGSGTTFVFTSLPVGRLAGVEVQGRRRDQREVGRRQRREGQ